MKKIPIHFVNMQPTLAEATKLLGDMLEEVRAERNSLRQENADLKTALRECQQVNQQYEQY